MNTIISVIGAGTMGSGIAQVAVTYGCQVNIIDSFPEALENSQSKLKYILSRLVEKGKINNEQFKSILDRIHWTANMDEISNSNMVIEAIVENLEIKQDLFLQMEPMVSDECILATNTSSLSVEKIASV